MHKSVLNQEILEAFSYLKNTDGFFVDGTLGFGGHSIAIITNLSRKLNILGIDKDESAIRFTKERIETEGLLDNFELINRDFREIKTILAEQKIDQIKGALLDLGVSSMQLDQADRGFSFKSPESALDMRMDQKQKLDAREVLNTYNEDKLTEILRGYGEEKFAKNIARNIIQSRERRPIKTIRDLLNILEISIPAREKFKSKHHFATKTFQAIRIEVNQELEHLKKAIFDISECLLPGTRLAVITFHSLEDRIVKNSFKELENPCHCPPQLPCICQKIPIGKIITKKPIIAGKEELSVNPRSRSAKLRILQKI